MPEQPTVQSLSRVRRMVFLRIQEWLTQPPPSVSPSIIRQPPSVPASVISNDEENTQLPEDSISVAEGNRSMNSQPTTAETAQDVGQMRRILAVQTTPESPCAIPPDENPSQMVVFAGENRGTSSRPLVGEGPPAQFPPPSTSAQASPQKVAPANLEKLTHCLPDPEAHPRFPGTNVHSSAWAVPRESLYFTSGSEPATRSRSSSVAVQLCFNTRSASELESLPLSHHTSAHSTAVVAGTISTPPTMFSPDSHGRITSD